jgi:ferredoxin-NADP reductase
VSAAAVLCGIVALEFEAVVEDIIVRTHDVKSFRFVRPSWFSYKAGQFTFVTVEVGGQKIRKPLTLSSSPTELDYIEFTKKLTGHPFSNGLDALRIVDKVELDAPYGNFTLQGDLPRVAMLAGGMGITPMRSLCRYCTDMNLHSSVTLLYANNTEADIVFRGEFEEMQKRNRNFRVVLALSEAAPDWKGRTGRISADMIREEVPDYLTTVFYVCGPPAMVDAMRALLRDMGVPGGSIKAEDLTGY